MGYKNHKKINSKEEDRYKGYHKIIGSKVKGAIGLPVGTRHLQYLDLEYPVNYGYVDKVLAGDGGMEL